MTVLDKLLFFFFKDLFILETQRERDRQREKQALGREPDLGLEVGLDPGISRITPQAEGGAKPLGHQGCPR